MNSPHSTRYLQFLDFALTVVHKMEFRNVTVSLPAYRAKDTVWDKVFWKLRDIFLPRRRWQDSYSCDYEENFAVDVVRIYNDENKCIIAFHPFTIYVQLNSFLETEPMKEHIVRSGRKKADLKNYVIKLVLHEFFLSIDNPPQKPLRKGTLKPWGLNSIYKNNKLRRVDLIVMTLTVLKKKNKKDDYSKYVSLQNFFFENIPEPYVAVQELRKFLLSICKESDYCPVAEYYCDLFKKVFPGYPELLHPRPLKHLCRCLFRKYLSSYGKKKQEVWSLRIPDTLKSYLLLDEEYHELCRSINESYFWVKYATHTNVLNIESSNHRLN